MRLTRGPPFGHPTAMRWGAARTKVLAEALTPAGERPAVVNGVVYVGSYDGDLYAFDLVGGLSG